MPRSSSVTLSPLPPGPLHTQTGGASHARAPARSERHGFGPVTFSEAGCGQQLCDGTIAAYSACLLRSRSICSRCSPRLSLQLGGILQRAELQHQPFALLLQLCKGATDASKQLASFVANRNSPSHQLMISPQVRGNRQAQTTVCEWTSSHRTGPGTHHRPWPLR